MRNLKKLLAVIVAICLVATLSVPAFAADSFTYGTQAQTLHDLGLYAGTTTGTFTPDLGTALDRETGVVLLLRVFGLEKKALAMTDAEVTTALTGFTDAATLPDWAKKQMAYAIANKLVAGMTTTTIGPKEALNGKMYASLILRQLGFTDAAYDTATTTLADKGGLTAAEATTFATKAMIKDDLVGMTFGSLKAKDTAGKTVIENLVAGGVVTSDAAVKAGLVSAEPTATAAATGVKKLTVTFNQAIDTTKATFVTKRGPTTVSVASVTYSADKTQAFINTAAKLIAGDYTVTVSGLSTNPIALTIAGVKDETPTKIELTSETAASHRDPATGAIDSAKIGYKVYNQYGEDITTDAATEAVNWTFSLGSTPSYSDGMVTMPITSGSSVIPGQTTGVLTGVMTSAGIVVTKVITIGASASADAITFDKVYNSDGNTLATDSTFTDFYLLIKSAKDQYGNDLKAADLNSNLVVTSSNTSVVALKPLVVNGTTYVKDSLGPNNDELGIQFATPTTPTDGTSTIRMISNTTGKIFTFDVTVVKKATVSSIQLQYPDDIVAANDGDVKIPFTALDQNGKAVTSYDSLSAQVSLTGTGLHWDHDYVNNAAVLNYTAPATAGTYNVMAMATSTGKYSQLTINVKDPAYASVVVGVTSDVTASIAKGATITVKDGYLNVHDQYDRSYDMSKVYVGGGAPADGKYRIFVKQDSSTDAVTDLTASKTAVTGGYAINSDNGDNDYVKIKGLAKGSSTIDFILQKYDSTKLPGDPWVTVNGSQFNLNLTVVEKSAITSYEVADIGTLFDTDFADNDGAPQIASGAALAVKDYYKGLTVNGIKADGSKVAMDASDYDVTTDNANVTYDNTGTFGADAADKLVAHGVLGATDDPATVTVIVTVKADGNPQTLTKTITVDRAAPKATTIALDTGVDDSATAYGVKYESAGLVSIALSKGVTYSDIIEAVHDVVNVTDQYGVEIPTTYYGTGAVILNNIVEADGDATTIVGYQGAATTTIDQGGSFNVTFVVNGKILTFKVKIV